MRVTRPFDVHYTHRLHTGRELLDPGADSLRSLLTPSGDGPVRLLAFVDAGLAEAQPALCDRIDAYFARDDRRGLVAPPIVIPGGESAKHGWDVAMRVLEHIRDAGLCRHSYVLVFGGGAVLDVVGLAAALAHRGVRLVRFPTTTLAQCDSGVGVKNGINLFGKKNYAGVFSPSWAVLNDVSLLDTLSDADWRAGFSEVVKVALVKDAGFFEDAERAVPRIVARDAAAAEPLLARSAALHLRHITDGGDPFELTTARPLDFGHWSAHRLEQRSGFTLRHGDAVAIGIGIDVMYSRNTGMLPAAEAARVWRCLLGLGFSFEHALLREPDELLNGLDDFREHLGGPLTITLLRGIGRGVDVRDVDRSAMRAAITDMASHAYVS